MSDLSAQTVRDFGEQWTWYRKNEGFFASTELFADIVADLVPLEAFRGAKVADIGSGTGRIVRMLADVGAAQITAVEPSDAFSVLVENTRHLKDRVTCIHATGDRLPATGDYDLVVSIGVLHHIPDPHPVVVRARDALRPGGSLVVWLYGQEGNHLYLAAARPLRTITRRLPHSLLASASWLLSIPLDGYIRLCRVAPTSRLPLSDYMRHVMGPLAVDARRLTIYDQLNPAYAKYYTQEEARRLLEDAGFENVRLHHRHGYSWTVVGTKPGLPEGSSHPSA